MPDQWHALTAEQRETVLRRTATRITAAEMLDEAQERQAISYLDLYRYAQDPASDADGGLRRLLRSDLRIRREWNALLRFIGAQTLRPAVAAADDEVVPAGRSERSNWRYEVRSSPVEPFETVIIIEVDEGTPAPRRLQLESAQHGLVDVALEPPHRGVIQVMFDREDQAVAILGDRDRVVTMW